MKSMLLLWLSVASIAFPSIALAGQLAPPSELWQQSYGSDSREYLSEILPARAGGFILAGNHDGCEHFECVGNRSSTGFGQTDFWLVRIDEQGNRLWDLSYGGIKGDYLHCAAATPDDSLILAGRSSSDVGGNRTIPLLGALDVWLLRVEEDGGIRWQRSLPAAEFEVPLHVLGTTDDGFVLGGTRNRGVWIYRFDSAGNLLWQADIPCLLLPNYSPQMAGIAETPDGHYAVVSNGGGSEPSLATRLHVLDDTGRITMERTLTAEFRELTTLHSTSDGGYVVGGSVADYEPERRFWYWTLRVDAAGDTLWETTYHGLGGADLLTAMAPASDGGFLLGGRSYSEPGFDKTTLPFGEYDYWIVRIDAEGRRMWDITYGDGGNEELRVIHATPDGGFLIGGESHEYLDHHPLANKTAPDWGNTDVWLVRLGMEDADGDGVRDSLDQCPDTAAGAVINASGCSIDQLCPRQGPWRNGGDYVRCLIRVSRQFMRENLITRAERQALIKTALRERSFIRPKR